MSDSPTWRTSQRPVYRVLDKKWTKTQRNRRFELDSSAETRTVRGMKNRIATALSVAGVLASGFAAYSLNTVVLGRTGGAVAGPATSVPATSEPGASITVPGVPVSRVAETAVDTVVDEDALRPDKATEAVGVPPAEPTGAVESPPTEPNARAQSFQLAGLGVVTAQMTPDGVTILSVSSAIPTKVRRDGRHATVTFTSGGRLLELRITEDGAALKAALVDVTPAVATTRPAHHEDREDDHEDNHESEGEWEEDDD